MKKQSLLQKFFFAIFFLIGTSAVSISILSDELVEYYKNKADITTALANTEKLKTLNADYEALIGNIEKDPNFAQRIASATLNVKNSDPNIAFPRADSAESEKIKILLAEDSRQNPASPEIPRWLLRCDSRFYRIALFAAGGYLIMIAFIFFGRSKAKE